LLWAVLLDAHGDKINTPSIKQQFDCHVAGGIAGGSVENDTWDLEYYRSSNPDWGREAAGAMWEAKTVGAACNWE
jgi:hypothetical protein